MPTRCYWKCFKYPVTHWLSLARETVSVLLLPCRLGCVSLPLADINRSPDPRHYQPVCELTEAGLFHMLQTFLDHSLYAGPCFVAWGKVQRGLIIITKKRMAQGGITTIRSVPRYCTLTVCQTPWYALCTIISFDPQNCPVRWAFSFPLHRLRN